MAFNFLINFQHQDHQNYYVLDEFEDVCNIILIYYQRMV